MQPTLTYYIHGWRDVKMYSLLFSLSLTYAFEIIKVVYQKAADRLQYCCSSLLFVRLLWIKAEPADVLVYRVFYACFFPPAIDLTRIPAILAFYQAGLVSDQPGQYPYCMGAACPTGQAKDPSRF